MCILPQFVRSFGISRKKSCASKRLFTAVHRTAAPHWFIESNGDAVPPPASLQQPFFILFPFLSSPWEELLISLRKSYQIIEIYYQGSESLFQRTTRVESWHIAGLDHFWFLFFKPVIVRSPQTRLRARFVVKPFNALGCCFRVLNTNAWGQPILLFKVPNTSSFSWHIFGSFSIRAAPAVRTT